MRTRTAGSRVAQRGGPRAWRTAPGAVGRHPPAPPLSKAQNPPGPKDNLRGPPKDILTLRPHPRIRPSSDLSLAEVSPPGSSRCSPPSPLVPAAATPLRSPPPPFALARGVEKSQEGVCGAKTTLLFEPVAARSMDSPDGLTETRKTRVQLNLRGFAWAFVGVCGRLWVAPSLANWSPSQLVCWIHPMPSNMQNRSRPTLAIEQTPDQAPLRPLAPVSSTGDTHTSPYNPHQITPCNHDPWRSARKGMLASPPRKGRLGSENASTCCRLSVRTHHFSRRVPTPGH
jgi:hypothetical protein